MPNQFGNYEDERAELLRKRSLASRDLALNRNLTEQQRKALIQQVQDIDSKLNGLERAGQTDPEDSEYEEEHEERSAKETVKIILFVIAAVFYLVSAVMLYKGHDKMTNYHNSEYYPSSNVNAYVGGDAYNYIINGNYATGFFVLAAGFIISGTICFTGGLIVGTQESDAQ